MIGTVYYDLADNDAEFCAVITDCGKVIDDAETFIEIYRQIKARIKVNRIVIDMNMITDDFFIFSTGMASEVLREFTECGGQLGLYGTLDDHLGSKTIRNFAMKCNQDDVMVFAESVDDAVDMLTRKARSQSNSRGSK